MSTLLYDVSTLLYDVSTLLCANFIKLCVNFIILCFNFMVFCDNGSSPGYFGFSPLWRGDAKTAYALEEYKGIHTFQFKKNFAQNLLDIRVA